jgi:hypothetical protein
MSGLSCAGWRDGRGRRCAAGVIRRSPLKAPLLQGQARQDVHGALDRGRRYLSQDVKTLAWPTARLAELRTHARNGVAFDVTTGLPAPEVRQARAKADELSWYEHALNYVTRRCKGLAGNSIRSIADTLATGTPVLLVSSQQRPGDGQIRDTEEIRKSCAGWRTTPGRWRTWLARITSDHQE